MLDQYDHHTDQQKLQDITRLGPKMGNIYCKHRNQDTADKQPEKYEDTSTATKKHTNGYSGCTGRNSAPRWTWHPELFQARSTRLLAGWDRWYGWSSTLQIGGFFMLFLSISMYVFFCFFFFVTDMAGLPQIGTSDEVWYMPIHANTCQWLLVEPCSWALAMVGAD